ncbi:hypothetical protein BGZ91_006628 [Linnemannia elongata]|nr:hypothetical protein BGZ91_006628 [Linnemannia elongata]
MCNRARPELKTDEGNDVYDSLTRYIRTRWPLTGITDTAALVTYLCAGWKSHSLFETMVLREGVRVQLGDRVRTVLERQVVAMLAEDKAQGGGDEPNPSANESEDENPGPCAATRAAREELRRYNEYSVAPPAQRGKYRQNPLSWWSKQSKEYKVLSIIAQQVLSMQASSVAAERLFSDAGNVVTK